MFIGHIGVGMAGKRVAPAVPLPVLLLASLFVDIIWMTLVAARVEIVRIVPKNAKYPVQIESSPWSHSLLMVCVWGALFALVYRLTTGDKRGSAVTGALVVSHWVLDWISHAADLPLYPGGRTFGLGLATHHTANVAVEVLLLLAGAVVYELATKTGSTKGRTPFWVMVALLIAICVAGAGAPPPESIRQLIASAVIGIGGTLLFSVYLNRQRTIKDTGSAGRVKVRTEQPFYR